MWLHSQLGFFSAVRDLERPGHLVVRARFEKDIRALCRLVEEIVGKPPKVEKTPKRDYLWRVSIGNITWGKVLARLAEEISYTNFKGTACGDGVRERAYHRCWAAMRDAQREQSDAVSANR
jgi:hypothetical protein